MKRLLLCVAAMALAVGCNDAAVEELTLSGSESATIGETTFVRIGVSMDESADTRVTVSDEWGCSWEEGDKIYAYSLDYGKFKMLTCTTPSASGDCLFEGEIYLGDNRLFTVNEDITTLLSAVSDSEDAPLRNYLHLAPTILESNTSLPNYAMISSEVVTITAADSGGDNISDASQTIYAYMKHLYSVIDLELTFTDVPSALSPILSEVSFYKSEDYQALPSHIVVDLSKEVDDSDFVESVDSYFEGSLTPSGLNAGGSCSLKLLVPSFTLANDAEIYAKFTFGDSVFSVESPIKNATGADFTFERGTYSTVCLTVSLDDYFNKDTGAGAIFHSAAAPNSRGSINTINNLIYLSAYSNGLVAEDDEMTGDYILSDGDLDLGNYTWVPINNIDGSLNYVSKFKFDGEGNKITGLTLDSPNTSDNQGLFGRMENAEIKNLTLSGATVYGKGYVGAICGYAAGSTVTNCYVDASSVSGSNNFVGAICGYSNGSTTITNCHVDATSSIKGGNRLGGIIGGTSGGTNTISYCSNAGSVTSSEDEGSYIGGIVGSCGKANVTACYNVADLGSSSWTRVGGVAGSATGSSLTACYNVGGITGDGLEGDYPSYYTVGGVVGYNSSGSTVTACYNAGSATNPIVGSYGDSFTSSDDFDSCYYLGDKVNETYDKFVTGYSTSVSELNNAVSDMNTAAGAEYYTTGADKTLMLPSLMGEVMFYGDGADSTTPVESLTEGVTVGGTEE